MKSDLGRFRLAPDRALVDDAAQWLCRVPTLRSCPFGYRVGSVWPRFLLWFSMDMCTAQTWISSTWRTVRSSVSCALGASCSTDIAVQAVMEWKTRLCRRLPKTEAGLSWSAAGEAFRKSCANACQGPSPGSTRAGIRKAEPAPGLANAGNWAERNVVRFPNFRFRGSRRTCLRPLPP